MAEWIEVLFGDPRSIVLDGGSHSPTARRESDTAFTNLLLPLVVFIRYEMTLESVKSKC